MGKVIKIYVDDELIYSGSLEEVPPEYRKALWGDLEMWADSLGKSGINELIYSHLAWYLNVSSQCRACSYVGEEEGLCPQCGNVLERKYVHERSKRLDLIMDCIGAISRVEFVD
ncbi:MAG: hypothetical protein QXX77_09900 [Candidatus Methanosuratincola sp.]|jgi:hypothetical protein